jgi:hypothetical protein
VPLIIEKYRGKIEQEIENKQREAELAEQQKIAEKHLK